MFRADFKRRYLWLVFMAWPGITWVVILRILRNSGLIDLIHASLSTSFEPGGPMIIGIFLIVSPILSFLVIMNLFKVKWRQDFLYVNFVVLFLSGLWLVAVAYESFVAVFILLIVFLLALAWRTRSGLKRNVL